jgi:allantoinase
MSNPRAVYSPIFDRPRLSHPDHVRVLIWPVINLEQWDINESMPRTIMPAPQGREVIPDIANFSWFDYGLRVGFWRLKRVLDQRGIKATLSLNAVVCDNYPQIVEECVKSDWEILAHGYVQRVINVESNEREVIRRTIDRITEFTGTKPRGWMGPGLAETHETPDILAEEGIEYVCDWCNDDQPYSMKIKNGRLISIPYTVELNDITIYVTQNHPSPEIFNRTRDHFETLYEEGIDSPRVMAISTHPYITGAAHRIKYYDKTIEHISGFDGIRFVTGGEILDWYLTETAP